MNKNNCWVADSSPTRGSKFQHQISSMHAYPNKVWINKSTSKEKWKRSESSVESNTLFSGMRICCLGRIWKEFHHVTFRLALLKGWVAFGIMAFGKEHQCVKLDQLIGWYGKRSRSTKDWFLRPKSASLKEIFKGLHI